MLNLLSPFDFTETINPDAVSEVTMLGSTGEYSLDCNGGQFAMLCPSYTPDAQNYRITTPPVAERGYEDHMDISTVIYKRSLPKGIVIEVHGTEATATSTAATEAVITYFPTD